MRHIPSRQAVFAAVFVALALTSTQVALAAHGDLDDEFGTNGVTTLDIGPAESAGTLVARDGKITIAGQRSDGGGNQNVLIARFDHLGDPDGSLNEGLGYVTTDFGGDDEVNNGLVVLSNGKIVVAGASQDFPHAKLILAKYNANGTPDTDFGGGDGKVTRDYAGNGAIAWDLATTSDGKLIVAGALYPANDQGNVAIWRFKANGKLDKTFGGGDGIATRNLGPGFDEAWRVLVLPNGKIVAGGWVASGDDYKTMVLRLSANGSFDDTFGSHGVVVRNPTGSSNAVNGLAMSGSKIVVAVSNNADVVLLRLNANGRRDTTFGGGVAKWSETSGASRFRAMWRSRRTARS